MAVPRHVWAERWPPCVIGRDAPFAGAYRVNTTLPLGLWREETTSGKTEKGRKEEGKKEKKENERQSEKKRKHNKDNGRTSLSVCLSCVRTVDAFCSADVLIEKPQLASMSQVVFLKPINYYAATFFYRF